MARRVAIVTGASGGIGAATVRAFLAEGYSVVGADLLDLPVLVQESPEHYEHHRCDVSDEAALAELFTRVRTQWKRIDTLANIAGTVLVKPFEATSWEDYRTVVDTNVGGTIFACKHAIPLLRDGGSIVNVASISGHIGQTDHAVYAATKGAVLALCRALAWELAPRRIRVNSVSPGSVDTAMLRHDISIEAGKSGLPFETVKAAREAEQSLGRWARPEEIAQAILFLAGERASYINGADLLVDSGWVAR